MPGRAAAHAARLRAALDARWPAWEIGALELVGAGRDAAVFRARSAAFGPVALRVPWTRWIARDDEPSLDARALLAREQLLASHMRRCGVPAPAAFALHVGPDDLDFLVSAHVDDDGGAAPAAALGALIRRIHEAPISAELDDALGTDDLPAMLAARIAGRLRVVQRRSGAALPDLPAAALRERLAGARLRSSVLHMGVRRGKLRVARGEIRAIVDWSNALIGDPALELARAAELGVRSPAFDAGYGDLPRRPAELDALYRLDTAAALAVASLSEAADPAVARRQVARVQELVAMLGPR